MPHMLLAVHSLSLQLRSNETICDATCSFLLALVGLVPNPGSALNQDCRLVSSALAANSHQIQHVSVVP